MSHQQKPSSLELDVWQPLDQFVETHSQFTLDQIRWLLRFRQENGFKKVISKVGKRIYINEYLFAEWMANHEC